MSEKRVWSAVCQWERVQPGRGVAAWIGGRAVAILRTQADDLYALSNVDPFSQASVLSRGLIGDDGGVAVLISPMYKQRFALSTGVCVEDPAVSVPTFAVRVRDGVIEVEHPVRSFAVSVGAA